MRLIGHKGADLIVGGNTLESFAAAAEHGVEMIEFDVLGMPDGPAVIAHDHEDARLRTPLGLDEALEAFTRPPLDGIEIDCDVKLPGPEEELVAGLRSHGLVERAMASTMYVSSLRELRELEPGLRLGWTIPRVRRDWTNTPWAKPLLPAAMVAMRARLPGIVTETLGELDVEAIWVFHRLLSRRLVDAAERRGVEVIAWTVDDAPRMRALAEIGVHGICSNDPRLFGVAGLAGA